VSPAAFGGFTHGHFPEFLHFLSGIFSPKFYAKDFALTASLLFLKEGHLCKECIAIRLYKIPKEKNTFSQLFYRFCGRV
jgi:hypothetical protein